MFSLPEGKCVESGGQIANLAVPVAPFVSWSNYSAKTKHDSLILAISKRSQHSRSLFASQKTVNDHIHDN